MVELLKVTVPLGEEPLTVAVHVVKLPGAMSAGRQERDVVVVVGTTTWKHSSVVVVDDEPVNPLVSGV